MNGKTLVSFVSILLLLTTAGASSAEAQTALWESRGQPEFRGAALEVGVSGPVIVVAGLVGDRFFNGQWYVRGLDRRTGSTIWEDRFGPVRSGLAKDVAVDGQRAFAAGWIFAPGRGFEFVVRAYDVRNGAVLWSREVGRGPQCADEQPGLARCVAKAVSVGGGRVFVVGHLTGTAARSDFAILAFDAETGTPLWDSVTDPTGTGANDRAWAVSAQNDRVFVLGEIGDNAGLLLRAHDARTGVILWQHYLPGARNFTIKDTLAAGRYGVFISGMDAESHFFVQGDEPQTGALLWEDHANDSGQAGEATAIVLAEDDTELFAVGVVGCDPATFLGCALAVRAYDARRGLTWQRDDAAAAGDWFAATITVGEGRVFLAAGELLDDGQYHGVVRAYAAEDGAFSWSAPLDSGLGQPISFVDGIAVRDGRLVVTAQANRVDGGSDFLVRSYRPR